MKTNFSKKLKVLVVENNTVDRKVILKMLSTSTHGKIVPKCVGSLADAFVQLQRHPFDVVLLDLNLDDSQGIDTLRRFHRKFPYLPVVVNTGEYPDIMGLKAISKGAQDYLVKGLYKSYILIKSLYYAVERKRSEEELKKAYLSLQQTQIQLIQAEKMNVVGGLASGVAHEVKNPLATILYGVEYLNTVIKPSDKNIAITLESIREASKTANNIIKGLLDFASLTNLKKSPEKMNSIIEHAVNLTRPQCARVKIEMKLQLAKKLPLARLDRNRIEQVIVDLIVNAIYAMSQGGEIIIKTYTKKFTLDDCGWIDRRGRSFQEGDEVIIVDVDDTGPGVRDEHLVKIFDPFFTTRRAAGGIGLGLSIARSIMGSHGGFINVYNRPGGGARARLIFKSYRSGKET